MLFFIQLIVVLLFLFVLIGVFFKIAKKIYIWMIEVREHIKAIYYYNSENNLLLKQLINGKTDEKYYVLDESWHKDNPIICHALGEIDGIKFTESLEAFEKHYALGSRVFEADFCLTSDGEPVIAHDWKNVRAGLCFLNGKKYSDTNKLTNAPMTKAEFSNFQICGKYTSLNLERFIEMMQKHKDVFVIISVKSVNQEYNESVHTIFTKLFSVW